MLTPCAIEDETAGRICSGLELTASIRESERQRFAAFVARLAGSTALQLLPSMEAVTDPAKLWALHKEHHRRGIPPVLRGPRHSLGPQGDLLDLQADLLWLQAHHPWHVARHRLARAILKAEPDGPVWHGLTLTFFARTQDTRGRVIALNLEPWHRADLRSLADAATRRRFDSLHGLHYGKLREGLMQALSESPDKSGRTDPAVTATRRAFLWRIHRLTGERHAETARLWSLLSGQVISRQQVARQVAAVAPIAADLERRLGADTSVHLPNSGCPH